MPAYAHEPGRNTRWPDDAFDAVKAQTPSVTTSAGAERNVPWRYGLALLSGGFYWECHEVLEPVWLNAPPNSRERAAVQAVIQTANAALKLTMDRPKAAARLAVMATVCLHDALNSSGDAAMGLDPKALSAALSLLEKGEMPNLNILD